MAKARFEAELIEGHKGVTVVIVPFPPEDVWGEKPIRLGPRRHGWLVTGTANGVPFAGYIGERWGRFFIIIDRELRAAADIAVGDAVEIVVRPTKSKAVLARARVQSQVTTAPKKPRQDAIDPES